MRQTPPAPLEPTSRTPAPLAHARAKSENALWWERLWPRLLPPVGVLALFLIVSWTGTWSVVPEWARLTLLGLFGFAALASLVPFTTLRSPLGREIDDRIERESAVAHRPVTAHGDRRATGGGRPAGRSPVARASAPLRGGGWPTSVPPAPGRTWRATTRGPYARWFRWPCSWRSASRPGGAGTIA